MRKPLYNIELSQQSVVTIFLTMVIFIGQCVPSVLAVDNSVNNLSTLRQAIQSGNLKLKVNGDSVNTTKISLQLTNTGTEPIKVVIPANEILKPNKPGVQTMFITSDVIVTVQPGKTAIVSVGTMCASPKSVPPPPPITEGLNFEVTDYKDLETWTKIAQIVEAGRELEMVGAFGNLMFPSAAAIKAMIDAEITKETERRIKELMKASPSLSRSQAELIIKKDAEAIQSIAKKNVLEREKRKRSDQIVQLAVWKTLGIVSGDSDDKVSPESIEKDILKELSEQIKRDKTLMAKLGGKLDKNGLFVPSKAQKKALDKKTSLIFDVVDLTVRRSAAETHKEIAQKLPNDGTCTTFCSVGERAFKQGNYSEAQELLSAALEEAKKLGEADPRLSRCLNSLGLCSLDMTNFSKAEDYFKRALSLRVKVLGPESKEVGETNNNLGLTKQQQEQFIEAQSYFDKAADIFEKACGKTSNKVANALNNLGRNYNLQKQGEDAKSPLTKALTFGILNCPKDLKGNNLYTPFIAEVETNLGTTYVLLGDFKKATNYFLKAFSIDKKQLGEEHPFIAKILDGLAIAASQLGQNDSAQKYQEQAQNIRVKSLGEENKEIAMLPLNHDAFSRIWSFVEGKKELKASVDNLNAATIAIGKDNRKVINKPIKDKWALVVGISKFKDPSINLKYASKDASDFAEFLVKEANFAPDHVRLLTDEKATREEIMAQLGDKWLPRVARPDDLVVIYFSSHGSPTQMDLNSVNYLVAHNTNKNSLYATGIPLQEFANTIKNRVQAQRVVLLMDACHSGAATGAKGIFRNYGVDANQVAQGTGQMVICSSSANQTSWESKRYKNSVFTHYLIEGLRKDPKLGSVFEFMKDKVQEEVQMDRHGQVQTPVLQSKWKGSDLIFTTPPTSPRQGVLINN